MIGYYVYILFSYKDRKLYTGYTNNLNRRIRQHLEGKVIATQNRTPLKIIYCEFYLLKSDAKRREKYLKGGNGRFDLKIQLKDILSKLGYKYLRN